MSHAQLMEWLAYFTLEPFGEGRADWRAAMQASVIANVHRRRGSRQFQPKDFMPRLGQTTKTTSPDAMLAMMKAAVAASGKGKK